MAESFAERRRRELGLTSPSSSPESVKTVESASKPVQSSSSFVERRKMELGLTKTPEVVESPKMKTPIMNIRESPLLKQIQSEPKAKVELSILDINKSPLMQAAKASAAEEPIKSSQKEWQNDPSRKLPVIGPILRGLDAIANNKAVETVGEVGRSLYMPGAGLTNIAGFTGAAESAVARFLPKVGKVAQKGISEAIVGAPLGAAGAQIMNPDASMGELAQGALFGAATGGALGSLGKGAAMYGQKAVSDLTENALRNVAENSRSAVKSPFSEGAAASNPIANSYTNKVGQSFNPSSVVPETPTLRVSPAQATAAAQEGLVVPPWVKSGRRTGEQADNAISANAPDTINSSPIVENAPDSLIKTTEPRIRDRIYNALDDAEKAARARLATKKNRLSSMPIDQWADHAVILAAQAGKGTIKLADATEFLVREFGEEIRPHVKGIVNRAKNVVKETERLASKEANEARVFNAAETGDASTFSSKVSRDINRDKTPFSKKWEKIRSQFVDDFAALEGVEKRIRGKMNSAEDSLYKSARMFRGVPEKANQIVKDRLSPIINDIEKRGYTTDQLGDYALAVHARDVNARDIKSGWTNKEIAEKIAELGTPEMEAARKQLIKISDDMLAELADTGVISKELLDTLRDRYKNYVPLFRALDDKTVNFADGLSSALANVSAPIKGLKGSEEKVIDPLESMVKNIFQSTNAAERNKVAKQLGKLAADDPDAKFIRKLKPSEEVGRKNVVTILEDGKKVQFEVEPEVYSAMLNLDKESSNTLIKILQKPASLLRAGATLTPEFSLRNPMRDVVQAFVTSNSGFNPIVDFPVGIIQSISKGPLYKEWVKELGAYGNIISNDRNTHQEALKQVLKETTGKKFVNVLNGKSLIKVLRAITDTTESATKVGEFRAAIRQGQTPQEAAYRSRDIMDFGRAGSSIREANKVVAFLNANVQGKSKLIRAFKENPAGFSARAFSAITVPTIGVFLMQKYMANPSQKQTIEESPNWMKDTFWLVPIPFTEQVARIPKPFDLNILFSNLPERALNYTFNNDKEAMDGFAKKAIADSALPGMITGLMPFIEGMANYSFFRQGRIIPQGEEGRNFKDQHDINTTETAKLLARGAEAVTGGEGSLKNFSSPRIMDNTIRGLTAGLGSYATSSIDSLLQGMVPFTGWKVLPSIIDRPAAPSKLPAQQPLAKAFLVNPSQSGKSTEQLYDLKDKLTKDKGSAKFNDKDFKDDEKLKFINDQTSAMSDITKEIREIQNSKSFTPNYKRDKIERLTRERNKIARDAMKKLN